MSITKYSSIAALLLLTACGATSNEQTHKIDPASQESNLLRIGNATRQAGDLKAAERLYLDAISQSKSSIEPHLALADLYQSNHMTDKAIAVLQDALDLQKDNANVAISLANLCIANNQTQDALKYAALAAKLAPDSARAFNTQGVALDNAGRYESAQKSYENALRLDGANSDYIKNNLALSYIMSSDFTEAIAILTPLAESEKSTPTVRQNLALAYGLKGDDTHAKEWLLKDLSEEKASENMAFFKQYSKEQLVSNRKSVDTAVEPVEVSDISIPKDLLAKSPATEKKISSIVPIMKPVGIAKGTEIEAPLKTASVPENPAQKSLSTLVPVTVATAKQSAPTADAFDLDYDEKNFTNDSTVAAIANAEPAAGIESKAIAPIEKPVSIKQASNLASILPKPVFKPVR